MSVRRMICGLHAQAVRRLLCSMKTLNDPLAHTKCAHTIVCVKNIFAAAGVKFGRQSRLFCCRQSATGKAAVVIPTRGPLLCVVAKDVGTTPPGCHDCYKHMRSIPLAGSALVHSLKSCADWLRASCSAASMQCHVLAFIPPILPNLAGSALLARSQKAPTGSIENSLPAH